MKSTKLLTNNYPLFVIFHNFSQNGNQEFTEFLAKSNANLYCIYLINDSYSFIKQIHSNHVFDKIKGEDGLVHL